MNTQTAHSRKDFASTLHVLVIEDNEVDQRLLEAMLDKAPYGAFVSYIVSTIHEARKILSSQFIDVALLDLDLHDSRGLSSLHQIHDDFPDLAIVVNTGAYQDELGLDAVTSGAQDYLIKGMYKAYGLTKALYYAVERKKAEIDLEAALKNLQEAQTHLIRAEKMNVIGGVASGIAHEVKNPLATILYGVEFLNNRLERADDKIELTLTSMKTATLKANDIIKDLLDFASLSELKKEDTDIHTVIDRALKLTYHQLDKQKIKLHKDYAEEVPHVVIDANRIEQVIVDIILNAIFAMHHNGELRIITQLKTCEARDIFGVSDITDPIQPGEDVVVVDFVDTGPGVDPDLLEKIFDPFFTTRRAAGGVGLGLSISRTIMMGHGGSISISNCPEGGACVRLLFKIKGDQQWAADVF
ncbi:MAG: sensor histidine kinase [Candidatus Omnitrophota bacterium]